MQTLLDSLNGLGGAWVTDIHRHEIRQRALLLGVMQTPESGTQLPRNDWLAMNFLTLRRRELVLDTLRSTSHVPRG